MNLLPTDAYRGAFMPATFRLMTANLLHERLDVKQFASILEEFDPDVVVTQELAPDAAEAVVSVYPHHHVRPSIDFTGRGIATRLEVDFGDIVMPGRNGTSAILSVGGGTVALAGIHLVNPINFPWWVAARIRRGQLAELFRWLDEIDGPVIVAGDFNASPRWPAYRQIAARLHDVVLDRDPNPERTWGWRPGWPRMLRIDHVFGRGVVATEVTVVPVAGSDHFAVVVDLELSGTA